MPQSLHLIICIVDHGFGEDLVEVTTRAGAQGGTILLGRGTAKARWLQLLGLDDTRKEVTLTIVPGHLAGPVLKAVSEDGTLRASRGVAVVVPVGRMIRHLTEHIAEDQGETMPATHELISVIVNSGYADDVMAEARKAGATGGTVINARGTGREEDVTFFGLTLVPEKELLLIIAETAQAPAILDAIRKIPCLAKAGTGITFCTPVSGFMPIGSKGPDPRTLEECGAPRP